MTPISVATDLFFRSIEVEAGEGVCMIGVEGSILLFILTLRFRGFSRNEVKSPKSYQTMNKQILPLRAGIGGRLVGFLAISNENDQQAYQGLLLVEGEVVLRGRNEGKAEFISRATRQLGQALPSLEVE